MNADLEQDVAAHYATSRLAEAILEGLAAAGADLDALTPEDLAPVDEFHTAGRLSTLKALALFAPQPGAHILDAGCGIGGTARCLAHEHGCRVTGLDLTPDFIEVARMLTSRTGLEERCAFEVGSVLAMPFDAASFDGAVSFHVAMNIEDRTGFYREVARVLRPGARFCLFDVMKGPTPGLTYPTPWAETQATSFLHARDEVVAFLEQAGFALEAEENLRDLALDFFTKRAAQAGDGPPPLGLHLLTGANSGEKFANVIEGYGHHQIEPVILVARRR